MDVFIIKAEVTGDSDARYAEGLYYADKIFGVFEDEKLAQNSLKEFEEEISRRLHIIAAYGEAGSSIRHLVTDLDTEVTIKIIKAKSNKFYYEGLE